MKRIAIACAFFIVFALLGCSLLGSGPPSSNPDDIISSAGDVVDGFITDACTDENKQAALDRAVVVEKSYNVWKRRFVAACNLIETEDETVAKYCNDAEILLSVLENEKERLMQIHNAVCDDP